MKSWPVRHLIAVGGIVVAAFVAAATLLLGTAGAVLAGLAAAAASIYLARRFALRIERLARDILRMSPQEGGKRPEGGWPEEAERLARASSRLADRFSNLLAAESAERRRAESILSSMQQGVVVVRDGGVVESANPASLAMLSGETQFQAGSQFASITRDARINDLVRTAILESATQRSDVYLRDKGRHLDVLAAPLPPAEDGTKRILALTNDVTESVRAENTRREFVSNASHELRTPIAAIRAAAETLQTGALDDPEASRDFVRRILDDVARMDALVSEMLELSRLESGQAPLHLSPVDPRTLVDDLIDRFRPIAAEEGVDLRTSVADDAPVFVADRSRIEAALANLVRNSLRATGRGGSITVSAHGLNGSVEIAVSDTGIGISSEHLPHIFERFYKADPSRGDDGTGLGLAISKHIVQAHGGKIGAESRLGEGATVSFSIPVGQGGG